MIDLLFKLLFTYFLTGSFGFQFIDSKPETKQNQINQQGLKTGKWYYFGKDLPETNYPEENLVTEGSYINGKKEGEWVKYHQDGKTPLFIGLYQDNKPHGNFKKFNKTGTLIESGSFINGKYDGTVSKFYDSGKIKYEGEFHHGIENGEFKHFDKNGKLELAYSSYNGIVGGSITQNELNNNEKLKSLEQNKVIEPKQANSISTLEYAPLIANPKVKNGTFNPNGYNKIYNDKDDILQDGTFKEGRLVEGRLYQYDFDGILFKVKIFKNGVYVSDGQI